MNTIFKINEQIKRKISGEITLKEEEELEKWASASAENRLLLDRHLKPDFISNIEVSENISQQTLKAWIKLNRKISKKHARKILIKRIVQVTAVVIPFAIFLTIANIKQEPQSAIVTSEECDVEVNKLVSEKKEAIVKSAMLLLGDGSMMELKPDQKMIRVNKQEILVNDKSIVKNDNSPSDTITNHIFRIPRGAGEYCITLSDGTKVWLNADSEILFPNKFVGNERVVIVKGELFFDVAKESGRKFIVRTSKYDIEVLGTTFNVRNYANEKCIQTTLISGKVAIQMNKKRFEMTPGNMCSLEEGKIKMEKVDSDESISWMTGVMTFRDKSFIYIMESVARWYDLNIEFEDKKLENLLFSGSFKRYDDLNVILNMFRDAGGVKIIQSGNKIIIRN